MKKDIDRIILELKSERERNKSLQNKFDMLRWILIIFMLIGSLSLTVFLAKEPKIKLINPVIEKNAPIKHEKTKPIPNYQESNHGRPAIKSVSKIAPAASNKKPFLIVEDQKLSMIRDSNGRMNWIPENQINDFERHEIAIKNFNIKNFESHEYNYEWTAKMQESIFQEIQLNEKFTNVLIQKVDCRADVGCKIDAISIDDNAKDNISVLAVKLGNIGRPKDGYFGRNYSMKSKKNSNFMEIFISGSVYD